MKRTSTLSLSILFTFFTLIANSQVTYVNNGNSTNYNLASGDSLYIARGTYTGNIYSFSKNAKISVAEGAAFRPASFSNPKGTLTVIGSARFNSISSAQNFDLENYGIVEITGSTAMNGGLQNWHNYFGATLKFIGSVTMNNDAELVNDGTLAANASFTLNSNTELINNNIISITGTFTNNSGNFINLGKFETGGIVFNSGASFTNNCRLVINGNITNNITIYNDGLIWIPATSGSAKITNNGTISNTANGKIKARNLTNYGTLTGKGYYYFYGTTYNTGTVGVSGTTADTIKFFDATRTNAATIFDVQYGNVRANAIFSNFAAPDTINPYPSCGLRYAGSTTVLPVKWNYFYVNLADNTPSLTWSSEQEAGTAFNVERSYDGTNFTTIATVPSTNGSTVYQYTDASVNKQSTVVYYRLKAKETSGAITMSETKLIRISSKQGVSFQASPSPFTSQFNINYQSAEKGNVTIKIYGMTGQLIVTKNAAVSKGFNSVAVTEAASLVKGVYLVQMTMNNNVIASEKIMKQ